VIGVRIKLRVHIRRLPGDKARRRGSDTGLGVRHAGGEGRACGVDASSLRRPFGGFWYQASVMDLARRALHWK
jgi:hypothetical protein